MFNKINITKIILGAVITASIFTIGILFNTNTALAKEQPQAMQQTQVINDVITIKTKHTNRARHIIPTLVQIKDNERIQFMNCQYVEYSKDTNTYNLVLVDTNNCTGGEWVIPLFKFNYNKQLLQELHDFFYNQISLVTLNNNTSNIEDDEIIDFQLLDEQFTGEQMDVQEIYEYMQNDIVDKLHINLNIFNAHKS